MNWEAFTVIGLATLFVGMVLMTGAFLFVRLKKRGEHAKEEVRLTKVGWVLVFLMLIVLFGGFAAQFLAPDSWLGQFVRTSMGRFGFLVFVVAVIWFVEITLKSKGINVLDTKYQKPGSGNGK